nr:mitogen-activated protein kinase 7 [Tanacetum cinerariifolium]
KRDDQEYNQLPPLVVMQPPPVQVAQTHSTHRSIETLVVVLAVITIVGVIAGFIARLCGGRHYGGQGGDHEFEGWIEKRCRSCIDAGVSTAPPPPPPPVVVPAPVKDETK